MSNPWDQDLVQPSGGNPWDADLLPAQSGPQQAPWAPADPNDPEWALRTELNRAYKENDGTKISELRQKLLDLNVQQTSPQALGAKVVSEMGPIERQVAGFGEGAAQVFRNVGNTLGLRSDEQTDFEAKAGQALPGLAYGLGGASITLPAATLAGSLAAAPAAAATGALGRGAAARAMPTFAKALGQTAAPFTPVVGQAIGPWTKAAYGAQAIGALAAVDRATADPEAKNIATALSVGVPAAGQLAGLAGKAVKGVAQPVGEAAQTLADEGYGKAMTSGAMNPGGFWHQAEYAASRIPWLGKFIKARQIEQAQGLQQAYLSNEMARRVGRKPPGPVDPSLPAHDWLKANRDRIYEDYARVENSTVPGLTKILGEKRAVKDSFIQVDPNRWAKYVDRKQLPPKLSADEVAEIGSFARAMGGEELSVGKQSFSASELDVPWAHAKNIRDQVREARRATDNHAMKRVYDQMDEDLSNHLESVMTPQARKIWRDTDRRYRAWVPANEALIPHVVHGGTPVLPARDFFARTLDRVPDNRLGSMDFTPEEKWAQRFSAAGGPAMASEASSGTRGINLLGLGPMQTGSRVAAGIGAASAPLLALAYQPGPQAILKGYTPFQKTMAKYMDKGARALSAPGAARFQRALTLQSLIDQAEEPDAP